MDRYIKILVEDAKEYIMQLPRDTLHQILTSAEPDTLRWIIRNTCQLEKDADLHKLAKDFLLLRGESL